MRRDTRPTILLVDDNPQIRSFIRPALEDSGFRCIEAVDGDEAVYHAEASLPDIIVLDIELGDPDMDGLDVCKRIRMMGFRMPVIFLTVRANVEDLEYGLQVAGPGSDYVKKLEELRRMQVEDEDVGNVQVALKAPDTHELIARIRARLPRDVQELGPHLRIDRKRTTVQRRIGEAWQEVRLQPLEYEVLKTLVDADGAVIGTWELFDKVFQGGSHDPNSTDESAVDHYKNRVWVCIANLRKKIEHGGEYGYIQTVQSIGYRFRAKAPD
jgi:DNA-binding response OmpR family regulator